MIYVIILILCIIFPEITVNSTKDTLLLWSNSVLPVLLPFLIISKIIYYSGGMSFFAKLLKPLTIFLGLPENAAFPYIMSILCGYPTGARTISLMEKDGLSDAEYYLNICYSSSPIFIIGTVGTSILKNTKEGIILFIIHMCTLFIFTSLYPSKQKIDKIVISSPSGNFSDAIFESIAAILNICGYMVFFNLINSFLLALSILPTELKPFFAGIIEFTKGIDLSSKTYEYPLPIISFLLSFGGSCVISQCLSFVKGTNKLKFVFNRFKSGLLAFILCLLYKKTALCIPVSITIVVILTAYIFRRKKYYLLKSSRSCEI